MIYKYINITRLTYFELANKLYFKYANIHKNKVKNTWYEGINKYR